MFRIMWPLCIDNGLSVVAIDDASSKIAGIFTALDEDAWMEKMGICEFISLMSKCGAFEKQFKLVDEINLPLVNEHKKLVKEKKEKSTGFKCEFLSVAVHPDFARRGIAAQLTNLIAENAVKQGFKIGYAQCSSQFSSKAMQKAGFKIENTIEYKDWEYKTSRFCCFCTKVTKPFELATEAQPNISLLVKRF